MAAVRCDALSRTIAATSRRTVLALTVAGLGGPLGLAGSEAKKRKRRKRKRRKTPDPICAASCPAPCHNCFHRPIGPPLCGNGGNAKCFRPCLSDSDCIGTDTPYCYTGATDRLTDEFDPIGCVNGNRSICINITPCG